MGHRNRQEVSYSSFVVTPWAFRIVLNPNGAIASLVFVSHSGPSAKLQHMALFFLRMRPVLGTMLRIFHRFCSKVRGIGPWLFVRCHTFKYVHTDYFFYAVCCK